MAAIVPEGFLFRKELANVRKFLTNNSDLRLIVSLPQGVFLPYTGVKTDIIFLENVECPDKTKHFWYFEVKNDGFTLNNHRRKIEGKNDLDIIKSTNLAEDYEEKLIDDGYTKISFEKIRHNHENWIGKQYEERKDHFSQSCSVVEIGEILDINCGSRITQREHAGSQYPVFGGGGESFKTDQYNRENDIVVSRFAMSPQCVRYVNGRFWLLDSGFTLLIKQEYKEQIIKDYIRYLLIFLQEDIYKCGRGIAQKNINFEEFKKIKIPLPPLSIQQEIVAEIDSYRQIIENHKKIIEISERKISDKLNSIWKKPVFNNEN